jgi:integrase/recombinase XerD
MRGLYQREDGNYYVRVPTGEKGKYDRLSLKTKDEGEAQRRAASLLSAYKAGGAHTLWQDLADRYRKEHFPVLKQGTQETYFWAIKALSMHLYDKVIREIDSPIIDRFVSGRLEAGITSAGVRSELAVLSSIMSKAEGWNLIDRNPVQRYMKANALKVRRGEPRVRWLTKGEEETILGLFDPYIAASKHGNGGRLTLKRAVILAIDTGLRLDELCQLLWKDIAFDLEQIHVRKEITKNKKDRWIPVKWRTLSMLKEMQEQSKSRWIFPALGGQGPRINFDKTLRYFVNGPCELAGIVPFGWHDLRRTCGCRLLQDDGLSMEQVSKWLGHASISVTERHYAFLTVDNLHRALRKDGAR